LTQKEPFDAAVGRAVLRNPYIVLLTKTGPRCISFRCKITVSFAQGAVHDAEADVADPVFVRSTIANCGSDCISELSNAVLALGHPLELQLSANVPREVLKRQLLKLPRGPSWGKGRPLIERSLSL